MQGFKSYRSVPTACNMLLFHYGNAHCHVQWRVYLHLLKIPSVNGLYLFMEKKITLGWNLPCSVLFLKMYFSHLNLTLCANKGRKPFTGLFPTSEIPRCMAIHVLKFLHKQSLFQMQPIVSVRCSFWVQWRERRKKVFQNGSMANGCIQRLLSASFPRFFTRKMSAAYMLLALGELWENISTTAVIACPINHICICVIDNRFRLLVSCWLYLQYRFNVSADQIMLQKVCQMILAYSFWQKPSFLGRIKKLIHWTQRSYL